MAIIKVNLGGNLSDAIGSTSARRWSDAFNSGVELPTGRISFTDGTGSGKVNRIAVIDFSVATTATLTIDLTSGQTDVLGRSLVLTKWKFMYVELDAANSGDVWIGPMNLSNPVTGFWDGTGATARSRVRQHFLYSDPVGYTVSGTAKNLGIYNDTLATVDGKLVIGGEA